MKTLYIIDGYSLMYTSYFAGMYAGLSAPSNEPTFGTYIFIKTLLKLLKVNEPDMICVAVDGPAKTFRKELYAEYKSNRKGKMPEDLLPQINRMKQILELMNFPIYYVPGYEADDVIGTIVEKATKDLSITIVSKDKDLFQLLTKEGSVSVLDPYKDKKFYWKDFQEKYNIRPNQFIDYLAFVGDTSDNIPGVKGIGPKTVTKLLHEYGSIENISEHIDDLKAGTAKKILDGIDNFFLSRDLATIRRDINMEINFNNMTRKEFDWDKLNPIFEKLGFDSLIETKFGNRELL